MIIRIIEFFYGGFNRAFRTYPYCGFCGRKMQNKYRVKYGKADKRTGKDLSYNDLYWACEAVHLELYNGAHDTIYLGREYAQQ